MDMVNWSAHGKTFRSQLHRRVHLSKLIHECLPTFHQLNKYRGCRRPCPACGSADETRDHVIRCVGPSRSDWHREFWAAIEKFHVEHRTAPILIYVFHTVMEEWLHAEGDVVASPILYPLEDRQLITQQNAIGWRQIFYGRFSVEWARIQQAYYFKHRKKTTNNRLDGAKLSGQGSNKRTTSNTGRKRRIIVSSGQSGR
jgi:hypothetical protein